MREYCKPTIQDAIYLAEHLNAANKREMTATCGKHILRDLLDGMKHSEKIGCCKFDGVPVAIYGVRRFSPLADYGLVWLFLGDIKKEDRYYAALQTKRFIQALLVDYSYVYNYVDVGNEKIIRWLKFLGAEFSEPEEFGLYRNKHLRFIIRRKNGSNRINDRADCRHRNMESKD